MCPPPLSSEEGWTSSSPAPSSSSKITQKGAAESGKGFSSQILDQTHMPISESLPNTYQLYIEGQTVVIPTDPVESFRFIREQTMASYRAIVSGTSTTREQALTFGHVVSEPNGGSRKLAFSEPLLPGAAVSTGDAGNKADDHVPAEAIPISDSPSPPHLSARKRMKVPQPEPPPSRPPSRATATHSERTSMAFKCKSGFIGDFADPYDVRRKTGMSVS